LYGSTTLQSRLFLKNIKNFNWKLKLLNNHSISSTHAERKITVRSHKHSFTPYPSLSPYSPTDGMTDRGTNTLTARELEEHFFQLCCCVSVFGFWWEIGFGVTYILRVQYSCGIVLVFWFWQEIVFVFAYVLSVQYSCAVVSVFWLWQEGVLV
jgi:hypothetical protein